MDVSPTQVGALVEFFWYAPPFNKILASVLLWLAVTFALGRAIESLTSGKLTRRGQRLMPLASAAGLFLLYHFAIYQKDKTVEETRRGIADYMVRAGLRDISFDQIRQTINADYSNNLLLAIGRDSTTQNPACGGERRIFRTSVLNSLSLKLLDSTRLKRIRNSERTIARQLRDEASFLAKSHPQLIEPGQQVGFSFREVDEVVLPLSSQLIIIATLNDYPEYFRLRTNQNQKIDSIYVLLNAASEIYEPLWFRKGHLIR
jgi:hypothetical protein